MSQSQKPITVDVNETLHLNPEMRSLGLIVSVLAISGLSGGRGDASSLAAERFASFDEIERNSIVLLWVKRKEKNERRRFLTPLTGVSQSLNQSEVLWSG